MDSIVLLFRAIRNTDQELNGAQKCVGLRARGSSVFFLRSGMAADRSAPQERRQGFACLPLRDPSGQKRPHLSLPGSALRLKSIVRIRSPNQTLGTTSGRSQGLPASRLPQGLYNDAFYG